jgi:DNA polymerase elongation subunit (family B)
VSKPKIILLDIETSPITAYTWRAFDDNALKILEFSKVMSVAWKELGKEDISCKTLLDYKGYKKGELDDEKLVREAWKVLDEADIVIAHHGDRFDLPKLNARFVYYGLSAPSSYKSIDTKKAASKYFRFDSNSLNNLGAYLNLGAKIENGGFSLWDRCIQGDKAAWTAMKEYNVQDVLLLEKVYLALRPFMESHPNLNAIVGDPKSESCPSCLSTDVIKRGFSITRTGRKQRFQCNACGSWSSGPFERVKNILVSDDE